MPLSEDDIQRIKRTVIERLGATADPAQIDRVVRSSVDAGTPADSAQLSGSAARRPMAASTPPNSKPETASESRPTVHPDISDKNGEGNRVIVATFGRNRPGIAAALTNVLAEHNCDIADITQKILQEFFSMIMIVDISACPVDFAALREKFADIERRLGVTIVAQHEDVFRAMHRI
jgi:ACT domain-containing protein